MEPTVLTVIPNYIKARSPDRLRALMLENNIKLKSKIAYFDIQFVSGFWYAWFNENYDIKKAFVNAEETNVEKSASR